MFPHETRRVAPAPSPVPSFPARSPYVTLEFVEAKDWITTLVTILGPAGTAFVTVYFTLRSQARTNREQLEANAKSLQKQLGAAERNQREQLDAALYNQREELKAAQARAGSGSGSMRFDEFGE